MRGPVAVFIYRLDGHLQRALTFTADIRQHRHFIFVALPNEQHQFGEHGARKASQAGLRIAQLRSGREPEHMPRERIAKPAAEGHGLREPARPENGKGIGDGATVRGLQGVGYTDDVGYGVLTVCVSGDESGELRQCVKKVLDAGLERAAFAAVDLVPQRMYTGDPRGRTECSCICRRRAVIYHDHRAESRRGELPHQLDQDGLRLPRRDQYRDLA